MERRVINTEMIREDKSYEANLRPGAIDEYIGQSKAKENLKIYI